ncbi:MAG: hypothetical protein QOF94_2760, partial [Acidobacteriaceae bacterium]
PPVALVNPRSATNAGVVAKSTREKLADTRLSRIVVASCVAVTHKASSFAHTPSVTSPQIKFV